MRIIAGEFGGRKLTPPESMKTRPTTDRVRESMFSALTSRLESFDGVNVLDAFSGSGALGLEALSRGAQSCIFFEKDHKAIKVLKSNIKSFELCAPRAITYNMDVFLAAKRHAIFENPFDLVLLDPPYAYSPSQIASFLNELHDFGFLTNNAVIVYEHSSDKIDDVELCFSKYKYIHHDSSKSFGTTTISYFYVQD